MKSVLILCDLFPPAFGPRMGYLCKYLADEGWTPVVVTEQVPGDTFDFLREGVDVTYVPASRMASLTDVFFGRKTARLERAAERKLAERPCDVVLCSTYREFPLAAARRIARRHRLPLVVDLRDNNGGDMGPMIAGLSPLLPDGVVVAFTIGDRRTPVALSDGKVSGGGTPTSVGQRPKLAVPVAVLTSERTASSGEQTLLAFRGMTNVRTFGQPSAGYASVNTVIPLYTGRAMVLTVGTTTARTGEEFGDDPIAPDEIREADEAPAAAQEWIANNQ